MCVSARARTIVCVCVYTRIFHCVSMVLLFFFHLHCISRVLATQPVDTGQATQQKQQQHHHISQHHRQRISIPSLSSSNISSSSILSPIKRIRMLYNAIVMSHMYRRAGARCSPHSLVSSQSAVAVALSLSQRYPPRFPSLHIGPESSSP